MSRRPKKHPQGARAQVDGIVGVGIESGIAVGGEEELGCIVGIHVLGDPIVDGDDGFFFGDEAAADICH